MRYFGTILPHIYASLPDSLVYTELESALQAKKLADEDQLGATTILTTEQLGIVCRELEARYGIVDAKLTPLGGELDANFRAITPSGDRFFVRVSGTPVDMAAIEWQNKILLQLVKRPLSVEVPQLVPQLDGSITSTFGPKGSENLLRVTSWVPGENIADMGSTNSEVRNQIGELAAEVIDSLSPLNMDQDDQNAHHWMVARSGDSLRETISAVDDLGRREHLKIALSWFDAVADEIENLPKSVVHQDLHDFNLLAVRSPDNSVHVSGIVDFNDAVYTIRLAEVAVAAGYATLRQTDPFEAFMQVVEGFASRQSINELEIKLLYRLSVARLAVNASTWTARSKVGNSVYAESRMAATWPALEKLIEVGPVVAEARIRNTFTEPNHLDKSSDGRS